MGLRAWVKDKAKKAKREVQKLADKAKRDAEKAARDAEWAARKAADEAERLAREAANQLEKQLLEEARKVVEKIFDDAKRDMERWSEDALATVKNEVIDEIEKTGKRVGSEIEEGLTEKLPQIIEDTALKLAKAASAGSIKKALDNAADVIEVMAPSKFTLIFGVELALVVQGEVTVSFSFPNPAAKLTEIRAWADKPPKGRAQVIECIKDFGPESLAVEFKVSGNGLAAEWDGDDKYDRIDSFLKKHGV